MNPMTEHWTNTGIMRRAACQEARDWAAAYPTPSAAWAACDRGDRMLWYAVMVGADRRRIVRAAAACARLALPFTAEPSVRVAVETAESWSRGGATLGQVQVAASAAAYAAAYAASASASVAARARALAKCADVVRGEFPEVPPTGALPGAVVR